MKGLLVRILTIVLAGGIISNVLSDELDSIDYPVKVCDQILVTMSPQSFTWWYFDGLVMEGMYRVWQRTGKTAYYDFFKAWIDRFVTEAGLNTDYSSDLNVMHNGFALGYMFEKTGEQKYKTCADRIMSRLKSYPRTSDGTPVHAAGAYELWLDGCWMLGHFLNNYGKAIGDKAFCDSMAAFQVINTNTHCYDPSDNLPFHEWSEGYGHSQEKWCRAIGWIVMDIVEILDTIPQNHPERQAIISILTSYFRGLIKYQDSVTGLWFQVVTKPDEPGNWVEQSSACMYSYAMTKAIEKGYVSAAEFGSCAKRAYQGMMGNVLMNANGYPDIYGTVEGTCLGDFSYYVNMQQPVNDPHGTGAWLISCEYQRTRHGANIKRIYQAEEALFNGTVENGYRGYTGSGYVNTPNTPGAYIQWNVYSAAAGIRQLTFRYANGNSTAVKADIEVNNKVAGLPITFNPGRWNQWQAQSIRTRFKAGNNTVRIEGAEGLANIDMLAVDSAQADSSVLLLVTLIDSVTQQKVTTSASVKILQSGTVIDSGFGSNGLLMLCGNSGDYTINVSAAGYLPKSGVPVALSFSDTSFVTSLVIKCTRQALVGIDILPVLMSMPFNCQQMVDLYGIYSDQTRILFDGTVVPVWSSRLPGLVSVSGSGLLTSNTLKGNCFVVAGIAPLGFSDSIEVHVIDIPMVRNSGFESPLLTSYQYRPIDSVWIFIDDAGIEHNGDAFAAADAPEGLQAAFLQRLGSVSQNIYLDSGYYRIRFKAAQRQDNNQTISVSLDETEISLFTPSSADFVEYVTESVLVLSGTHLLKFAGMNESGDNTAFIDAISVEINGFTDNEPVIIKPENFVLAASPNPFNPSARISWYLPQKADVSLRLYNLQGKIVRELAGGMMSAGSHTVRLESGKLASGIYIFELKSGAMAKRLKLVLMR